MKKVVVVGVAATAALALSAAIAFAIPPYTPYHAKLTATAEVPKQTVAYRAGSGEFSAKLTGRVLTWALTIKKLSGPPLMAHIHLGGPGKSGPVVVPLCGPCKMHVSGRTTLSVKVMRALVGGLTYVNVHTKKNPAGEIRGQLIKGPGM